MSGKTGAIRQYEQRDRSRQDNVEPLPCQWLTVGLLAIQFCPHGRHKLRIHGWPCPNICGQPLIDHSLATGGALYSPQTPPEYDCYCYTYPPGLEATPNLAQWWAVPWHRMVLLLKGQYQAMSRSMSCTRTRRCFKAVVRDLRTCPETADAGSIPDLLMWMGRSAGRRPKTVLLNS